MENKKLGGILMLIALLVGGIIFYFNSALSTQAQEEGCFENNNCAPIEEGLSITHFAIGVLAFLFSLGFYLIFFNKTDEKILRHLEAQKNAQVQDEKYNYILMALDPFEQKVIKAIREQEGITQNTLRLRTDMSKSKLSYVLQELEKRNLIKRKAKGKTLEIHLKV
jgi:uncharacterized membrane protein